MADSDVLGKLEAMLSAAKRDGDRKEAATIYDAISDLKNGHDSTAKVLGELRAELDALKKPPAAKDATPPPPAKTPDEAPPTKDEAPKRTHGMSRTWFGN
jgi:hypothetical protein